MPFKTVLEISAIHGHHQSTDYVSRRTKNSSVMSWWEACQHSKCKSSVRKSLGEERGSCWSSCDLGFVNPCSNRFSHKAPESSHSQYSNKSVSVRWGMCLLSVNRNIHSSVHVKQPLSQTGREGLFLGQIMSDHCSQIQVSPCSNVDSASS